MVLSALSALLGAGSSIANHFVNRANLEDARSYNSPAAQMARLKYAGINPYSQAANGNIDSTFNQVQESDFEGVSHAFNQAVDGFTKREQMRINRSLAQGEIDMMAEKVRGLELDNQYKSASLNDRVVFLWQKTQLASLDYQIKNGIITRQDADNRVAEINAQVQEYMSGSGTFMGGNVPVDENGYTDIPILDQALAGSKAAVSKAGKIHEDLQYLLDTHQDRVNYAKYRSWREFYDEEYSRRSLDDRVDMTQSQAKYWFERALREEIAEDYETTTGLPWFNKDIKSHILTNLIHAVGKAYNAGARDGKFDWRVALEYFFEAMTSAEIDIPGGRSGKNLRKVGGAGGKF